MKIHEFQAKGVLRRFGVPVPRGEAVETAEQARRVASDLGGGTVVVITPTEGRIGAKPV